MARPSRSPTSYPANITELAKAAGFDTSASGDYAISGAKLQLGKASDPSKCYFSYTAPSAAGTQPTYSFVKGSGDGSTVSGC